MSPAFGLMGTMRPSNPPRVKLVIKTHSIDKVISTLEKAAWQQIKQICEEDRRIVLVDRLLTDAKHHALIEGSDCFVSLHRSEGLGYHLLEAMYCGVPVIATDYSGSGDFCTTDTAFLTDFRLVNVGCGQYARASASQVWADPDCEQAARHMVTVFRDRRSRETVAANARRLVETEYSTDAVSGRLATRLATIGTAYSW